MGKSIKVSTEWEQIFGRELGGVNVTIQQARAGQPPHTDVRKSSDGRDQNVTIFLSSEIDGELGQLAQLRHEHGLIELNSFGLKHGTLSKLSKETVKLIEDARINLQESERYIGYRDGYSEIGNKVGTPLGQFLFNTTQAQPANDTEKKLFAMARRVNSLAGARRGEYRGEEFYQEYAKYAAEVVRYVGTPPTSPDGPGGKGKPGSEGSPFWGEGEEDGGPMEGDGNITQDEADKANAATQSAQPDLQRFFAPHSDVNGNGGAPKPADRVGTPTNQHGLGSLMNPKLIQPLVENDIQMLVNQKLRKLRMAGKKNKEAGIRMNMRVAARAMFTGETKMFGAPAKKDIKNAKFVIVQDISGSMGCADITVFGKNKMRIEVAYHFGMGMKKFLEREGAHVEEFRYDDSPFRPGLTMEIGGGTCWGERNMEMLREWVQKGKQVIILTDGYIGFDKPDEVKELFKNPDRRPVGMQIGGGGSDLEKICPDWAQFTVTNDPNPALDAMVRVFARRFKF